MSGGVAFDLSHVAYLRSAAGEQALAEVAERRLTGASLVSDIAAVRKQFGDHAGILVETVALRRRAAAKFDEPGRWLFTDEALQQATAAPVAAHRARRLAGSRVHDATCSIGSELVALRGCAAQVLGSDLDPVRLAMAANNAEGVDLCRADALAPVTRDTVVIIDPARRTGGRRRFDPRAYTPALDAVLDVYRGRDLVVKCAPGIDFDALTEMGFAGEIEVTSLGGSVREACLWSPGLTEPGIRRRASMLETGEQITDAEPDDCPVAEAGRWIVDPDGAVVRAGLVRHYAARHGLWQLDPDIAYLSGDQLPAGVRGFEVLEQLQFQERRLRAALTARSVGALEILVRGVDVDPDALRTRMRLRGTEHLAVVIARLGSGPASRAWAFICRPSR
ncbi:SAM-dependent methyltransferase [Mycolicibacterium conceptionense]|uniref:SAM-dependent methyltransferase n=1 Tax=Mycolicibacterium conceptionense TaxID=451644 RepID=A0A1A1WJF1_9MYCO|nr:MULTISPECIES: class I SAM-dependent methyltransferase [Mycolicibacterium]OBB11506.1 SAM-dependent methyltransferase [Mycolicibacterium conceptionense]OBF07038.1 SAM-dependent methyltransferase [Mycolicibacterium conceptionense]OBF26544.1 SAM-dependent methyltransferase [Mycolicibacterium conceptionense]OBF31212.1 SAM-dependent methyltransferase [Mycolicibacterium conceptionense]OBH94699.1 SAM-dependent methyltransferase [Mycolicibacterium conceptionense]